MGMNWNEVFAYTTVKMVRVHDMRLGILHYAFTLTIALYIIVGVMLVDKEYLLVTQPEGTVRVGLLTPGVCADETGLNCDGFQREAEQLPYCDLYDGPTVPGLLMPAPFQCRYADQNFAIWPAVEQRGVFATTRVTETEQALPAGCDDIDTPLPTTDCYNWEAVTDITYYVSQIEYFTAFIDHTVTASALGLSKSWPNNDLECLGLFNDEGEKIDPCDDYSAGTCPPVVQLATGQRNIVPLKTLLRAAGIDNLDTFGDVDCGNSTVSEGCESARYSGIVLQVNIEYYNNQEVFNFDPNRVQYRYTVDHVKESEFKAYEIIPVAGDGGQRIENNRHGIRIVFRQIGELGAFDFQTLLVNLVVALGLLGAATTMVDLMMLYVLPQKTEYEDAKNEEVKVRQDGTLQKEKGDPAAARSESLESSLIER